MNDDQIKIANELLKYIYDRKGYCSNSDLYEFLHEGKYDRFDVLLVQDRVQEQNFLNEKEVMTTLTQEGSKAAKMGYSAYLDDVEKKEKDKDAKDHRDAVMSKWQIIIFWPMFVFATIGTLSGIISLIWQVVESMK